MKKIVLFFSILLGIQLFAFSQNTSELKPYTDFLKNQNTTAKEYIFDLFKKYDIVILCERDHREMSQYNLILDILRDDRFTKKIKNAYFEIGNSAYNDTLNHFLRDASLTDNQVTESVMSFQRDIHGAPFWEKANYSFYIEKVHGLNKKLSSKNKINIYGLDTGIYWPSATEEDIRRRDSMMQSRDSVLATNFVHYFDKQDTKKALIVLNFRHAFLRDLFGRENAGRFIADTYKGKVANVYINSFGFKKDEESKDVISAIQDGKWDAAFIKAEKMDVGFDFAGTPFGSDSFDMIPFSSELRYSDMFTGFVYYCFLPSLRVTTGIDGFVDDQFAPELMRRYQLEQKVYNNELPEIDKLKLKYNTVIETSYREEFPAVVNQIDKWLN